MNIRKTKNIFLGLGSNLGNRLEYLYKAINEIHADGNNNVVIASSIYETRPFGNPDQNNFLNAVIKIESDFQPDELLSFLKKVEKRVGRIEREKWNVREIDIDILFYDDLVMQKENIEIPHHYIASRDFVLIPLCEIEPNFIHPVLNRKICDICIKENESFIIDKIKNQIMIKGLNVCIE
jgi:2-amino-4-hydroxy-6-hydroxymethyldihydropteridine diphosphokinase